MHAIKIHDHWINDYLRLYRIIPQKSSLFQFHSNAFVELQLYDQPFRNAILRHFGLLGSEEEKSMEFSWFDRKLTYFTAFLNYNAPHLKKIWFCIHNYVVLVRHIKTWRCRMKCYWVYQRSVSLKLALKNSFKQTCKQHLKIDGG